MNSSAPLESAPPPTSAVSPLVQRLLNLIQAENYSPPQLPSTAVELLELARQDAVQPSAMVGLLERDPMLAAELLRLAQSSAYGAGSSVRTLDEAIVRLGLRRTAELFLHVALEARVFRAAGYQTKMNDLRKHSVAVAHLSRLVARQAGVLDQSAFICGLLHDVGIAATLIALVETCPADEQVPDFSEVWPAIETVHLQAGGILASTWRFPSEVTYVIERHHDFVENGTTHPLSAVVNLADWLAAQLGRGFSDERSGPSQEEVFHALKLSESDGSKLLDKASRLLERLS